MDTNSVIFILALIGILLVAIYLSRIYTFGQCPAKRTVYRFVPRSLEEEMLSPVPLNDVFNDMFAKPSPWVGSFNVHERGRAVDGFVGANGDGFRTSADD